MESQATRKQIKGSLFSHAKKIEEIEAYCAMGALMCESGMLTEVTDDEDFDVYKIMPVSETKTIEYFAGKGANHFEDAVTCPLCSESDDHYLKKFPYLPFSLASYIIHLNDTHSQTFEQIGKYLEKMGY